MNEKPTNPNDIVGTTVQEDQNNSTVTINGNQNNFATQITKDQNNLIAIVSGSQDNFKIKISRDQINSEAEITRNQYNVNAKISRNQYNESLKVGGAMFFDFNTEWKGGIWRYELVDHRGNGEYIEYKLVPKKLTIRIENFFIWLGIVRAVPGNRKNIF